MTNLRGGVKPSETAAEQTEDAQEVEDAATEEILETEEGEEFSGNESENIRNEDAEEEISVISDTTEQSGNLGKNLTWTLSEDGTLTISGTGDMDDYDGVSGQLPPWHGVGLIDADLIKKVIIEEGVTSIGNEAFQNCTKLGSVDIPASVTSIGQYAFFHCGDLASINIPASVTSIGQYAFFRCGDLASINIPEGVTSIEEGAFTYCSNLANINIPEGVTSIGQFAFEYCSNLASITIPTSVTSIKAGAFDNCDKLTNVDYAGNESAWKSIKIDNNNESLLNSNIKYNGTEEDTKKPPVKEPDDESDESKPDNNKTTAGLESEPDSKPDDTPWTPTTPEEKKRYDCVGKDSVKYTVAGNGAYPVRIVNIMQGPKCFESFEAGVETLKVLGVGNYTISRTFDIYPNNKRNTYNMGQETELTITIPADISRTGRQYKMLCVTEGGIVVILDDLDSDPNTITIRTDKFHAFALIYK
ncbi:MAG: leucine-rich repeat domain-containing protein [Butyrivibrio sp.]|nr:leucine-rich repeat domain-containing protein [Butyrivibrio sp.]